MSSMWTRLVEGRTTFNFYGRRRIGFGLSLVLFVGAGASLLVSGLNLGIDFKGGVAWEVPSGGAVTEEAIRTVIEDAGVDAGDVRVQTLTSQAGSERIRVELAELGEAEQTSVTSGLADLAGVSTDEIVRESVSSRWGRSVTDKSVRALVVFFIFVSLFISWRFEWRMAIAALSAVVHDILITVGVYAVFGFEVTPATVVAFLTILGYSMYDTIVVFDRVRDNEELYSGSRVSYGDIVNVSMNQVLMRTLNTSISAVLPVLSLLVVGSGVLGVTALREFSLALFVGLITGAYSSIYIATPVLGLLKERSTKYASMRGQLSLAGEMTMMLETGVTARKRARNVSPRAGSQTDEDRGPGVSVGDAGAPARSTVSPAAAEAVLSHPPRPRKKRRR